MEGKNRIIINQREVNPAHKSSKKMIVPTKTNAFEQMTFDVNYPQFAKEACENCVGGLYAITWNILNGIIAQVAQRAVELNDPVLNALMIKLNLYEMKNEDRRKYIKYLEDFYNQNVKQ